MALLLRSIIVVVALTACGGSKSAGPTCEQVTDHILEVTKQQLPGHENTNLLIQRKAMVEQCEKREMPVEVRTCLMGARTLSEISVCRGRGKSSVGEKPRRPRPPAGSGGSAGSAGNKSPGSAGSGSAGSGSGRTDSGSGSARAGSSSGSARTGSGSSR